MVFFIFQLFNINIKLARIHPLNKHFFHFTWSSGNFIERCANPTKAWHNNKSNLKNRTKEMSLIHRHFTN